LQQIESRVTKITDSQHAVRTLKCLFLLVRFEVIKAVVLKIHVYVVSHCVAE